MTEPNRSSKLYDERLRDIDRERHQKKMTKADQSLDQSKRKLQSARQLYEERLRDYD